MTLPSRASDAGPEDQPHDWYDWLWLATEDCADARRTDDVRTRQRLIDHAIEALQNARGLL